MKTPTVFGIHREAGGKWLVAVLKDEMQDRANGRFRVVRFRCLYELRPSPIHGSIPVDHEGTLDEREGYPGGGFWTLTYLKEEA